MKKELLILAFVASILGISSLYFIPFLIPFCFAWIFNELDQEKSIKKSISKILIFSYLSSFYIGMPLIPVIEKYFSLEKYHSYIGYIGYNFIQSLGLFFGLLIAYLFNKFFIFNRTLRFINFAFTLYFITSIYPYLVEYKFSISLLKFNLPLIQFADMIGFFGLDLVLYLISAGILVIFYLKNERLEKSLIGLILIIGLSLVGLLYKKKFNNYDEKLAALSIQSNLPSFSEIFKKDPKNYSTIILSKNYELTKKGLKKEHDLVIWTESEIPFFYNSSTLEVNKLSSFVYKDVQKPVIAGAMYSVGENSPLFYNSAVYINGNGSINSFYHKRHLMPLSEKRDFGWINFNSILNTIEIEKEYKGEITPFILKKNNNDIKILTIICYEALLSKIKFDFNPDLILVLSNDYFFRGSPVLLDMINYMMISKAIEFRKPLIRTARIGPSSSINANGNMFAKTTTNTEVAQTSTMKIKIDRPATFYYKTRNFQHFIIMGIWILVILGMNFYFKKFHIDKNKL